MGKNSRRTISGGRLIIALYLFTNLIVPVFSYAESTGLQSVIISELQTATSVSASQEFVELYNTTNGVINLSGWKIEYKSATGTSWTVKSTLSGSIQPRGFYLVATDGYFTDADDILNSGLAGAGGHVRLVEPDASVSDLVGWGTADSAEGGAPAVTPAADESITRSFDTSGQIIDTDYNNVDFALNVTPSPSSTPSGEDPDEPTVPDEPYEYLPVEITELFPDPASPQTDAIDEFIEIYNPNDEPVELAGYVVKNGSSLQHSFVIGDITIEPHQYLAFYSAEGNITLSNSGGSVQIFDPDANPISDQLVYPQAKSGQSWALIDDVWQWTSIVTPAAPNQLDGIGGEVGTAPLASYPSIIVNELLVDPASPSLDDEDEFVELYNPNTTAVNLGGFKLLTGSTLRTSFTLPADVIGPGEYRVYYSKDVNISLSNGGGSVRLLDPNDLTSSEVQNYDKATAGDAWARFDSGWQWTGTPTPGAANAFSISQKAAKAAKTKKSSVKKASTKKPKAAKTKKANTQPLVTPATIPPSSLTTGVVATAAGLGLLYGAYEFRYDIRNKFELARRYFAHRWHSGP